MKNKKVLYSLIAVVLLQVSILIGVYVSAALPLWLGKEVTVKTLPIDPRSLLRGQYVRLNYDFSRIPISDIQSSFELRNGEIVYVRLQEKDGIYTYLSSSLEKPNVGIFLRGRIANKRYEEDASYFRIYYGLEALFLPKDKAIEMEKTLSKSANATIKVMDNGKARLVSVSK